ncbi:hypothetical protein HNR77_001260 [Paenibacillus sp. JGP012]|uniref:hypothetical protein n=1 Tax=Paenibacillus sp. JGP012 TaxID=2735914 RepID=UPI00161DC8EC|nr:hypothetical protein [Paenibacillus sp. JGP012]MBB6020199.1 hypothetical protein [Paenibacillus sp. JGP012]
MINLLWTIYLGLLGTASLGYLLKGKYKSIPGKIDFVVSVITWIGLLGYVKHIQWLNPLTWKVITISALLWDILFGMLLKDHQGEDILQEISIGKRRALMFVTLVLALGPLYYGLFRYSF